MQADVSFFASGSKDTAAVGSMVIDAPRDAIGDSPGSAPALSREVRLLRWRRRDSPSPSSPSLASEERSLASLAAFTLEFRFPSKPEFRGDSGGEGGGDCGDLAPAATAWLDAAWVNFLVSSRRLSAAMRTWSGLGLGLGLGLGSGLGLGLGLGLGSGSGSKQRCTPCLGGARCGTAC